MESGAPEDDVDVDVHEIREGFYKYVAMVEKRIKVLEEKEKHWKLLEEKLDSNISIAANKITLDVGGKRFAVSKSTLLACGDSFFAAMLSSGKWKPDADGTYFIDRDPKLFPLILEYLRTGKVNLKRYNYDVTDDLKLELDFYQIDIPEITRPKLFPGTKLLATGQQNTLHTWIGNKQATLLYSATCDGFGGKQFHAKCDNKGPTVVVIKSGINLFGGYASQSWDSSGGYKACPGSFLFTLANTHGIQPTTYLAVVGTNRTNTIYCSATYGPTFGSGHDIYISDNANSNTDSYSAFPNTYGDTTGKGYATFAGQNNFQVADIEVYLVQ